MMAQSEFRYPQWVVSTKWRLETIRWALLTFVLLGRFVAFGEVRAVEQSRERQLLFSQIEMKYAGYTNSIAHLTAENKVIERDRRTFLKAFTAVSVPEFVVKTNITRLARNVTMTTVVTNSFKEEARVRKLAKAMKDKTINTIYEKYFGEDCSGLYDDFMHEWKEAEAGFADTKAKLAAGDRSYRKEVSSINAAKKREHDNQIVEIDQEIGRLKRERAARMRNPGFADTSDINSQIRELENRKKTLELIYKNNRYAESLSAAGSRKMDRNDMVLAQADLRDQQQAVYMVYNNKLKGDLLARMDSKLEANTVLIEMQKKELNRLGALFRNKDMISVDVAKAIVDKQMDEALDGEFGVTSAGVRQEKKEAAAREKREVEEEEERQYRKKRQREKEAEEDQERQYQRKLQREQDAVELKEREHAMEVERATRSVRIKEQQKDLEYQRERRRELDKQDDLDRAAIRKLLEAESDALSR